MSPKISLIVFLICLALAMTLVRSQGSRFLREGGATNSTRQLLEHTSSEHLQQNTLFPLSRSDEVAFVLASLTLMIAAGGGIGGGGVLVPIYIFLLGFSAKRAIPLSSVTVFGGSIANSLVYMRRRHPHADRPLINWDMVLVMQPLTVAGALIGALLVKLLPELVLAVILVVLLSYISYITLKKAIQMYNKETQAIKTPGGQAAANGKFAEIEPPTEETPLMASAGVSFTELSDILEQERKVVPLTHVSLLTLLMFVALSINLLKGGSGVPSPIGIECGSVSFWLANAMVLVWALFFSWRVHALVVKNFKRKQQCQYHYLEGDIVWDSHTTIVFMWIGGLAGLFSGMFGIGGGVVAGPLILTMGVPASVSAACTGCMTFVTTATAATSFLAFGLLDADYAGICICIGFVASLVGQVGITYLMKKAKRTSYTAFCIGFIVLISAVLMSAQSVLTMVAENQHQSEAAPLICSASAHK